MTTGEKKKLQQAFGKTIEKLRLERNMSQAELAELGEFNRTYISDLERGLKQPSLSTIVRLSRALKIHLSDLMSQLLEANGFPNY